MHYIRYLSLTRQLQSFRTRHPDHDQRTIGYRPKQAPYSGTDATSLETRIAVTVSGVQLRCYQLGPYLQNPEMTQMKLVSPSKAQEPKLE